MVESWLLTTVSDICEKAKQVVSMLSARNWHETIMILRVSVRQMTSFLLCKHAQRPNFFACGGLKAPLRYAAPISVYTRAHCICKLLQVAGPQRLGPPSRAAASRDARRLVDAPPMPLCQRGAVAAVASRDRRRAIGADRRACADRMLMGPRWHSMSGIGLAVGDLRCGMVLLASWHQTSGVGLVPWTAPAVCWLSCAACVVHVASTGCAKRIATFAAMPRRLGRQLPRSHARRHPWMPPGCPAHIELCRDAVHSQLLGKFQSARGAGSVF